jgi:hypothetical protein
MSVTGRTWLTADEASAYEASKTALAEVIRQREEARALIRRFVDVATGPGTPCLLCNRRSEHQVTCPVGAAKKMLGGAS